MQQFSSFIILTFIYSSTCFGCFPSNHLELDDCSGSLWFLPSSCGDSRAVSVVGQAQLVYLNFTMMHGLTNLELDCRQF